MRIKIIMISIATVFLFSMIIFAATALSTINTGNSGGRDDIHETSAPFTGIQIISPTITARKTPTPTKTSKIAPDSAMADASMKLWGPDVYYEEGTIVSYRKSSYKCLQGHISLVGWEPSDSPALWQKL